MKAVIMAGGKGTRLSSVTNDIIPKSMVRINGIPILEYQIRLLARYHIEEVIIAAGFLHEAIESYFGKGDGFSLPIKYLIEDTPKGTGGILPLLKNCVKDEFLLVFGDLIFDFSIPRMLDSHKKKKALITLFAHPNSHPYDSDLLLTDMENKVIGYCSKHETRNGFYRNLVNSGIYLINEKIFKLLPNGRSMDMEKDIIFPFCKKNYDIFAYVSSEYVKDIGTPNRLLTSEDHINTGIVKQKNFDNPQKCIFLDMDIMLNKNYGFINSQKQLNLEETFVDAIKEINNSSYLAIVIASQLYAVYGSCSENDVTVLCNKLETLLGEQGGYLDSIYYPYHPDKGCEEDEEKSVKYRTKYHCCKPDIGMIGDCVGHFNISLNNSFFIGYSSVNIPVVKNAGLKILLVQNGEAGTEVKYNVYPDYIADNVYDAVKKILSGSI